MTESNAREFLLCLACQYGRAKRIAGDAIVIATAEFSAACRMAAMMKLDGFTEAADVWLKYDNQAKRMFSRGEDIQRQLELLDSYRTAMPV
jgi:hypothetical protein